MPLKDRRISADAMEKYGVTVNSNENGDILDHYYPYLNQQGEKVAVKIREVPKSFKVTGDFANTQLFGQHLIPKDGKFITLVEGELDALAVYDMMGYPAVSVKDAGSALKDIKRNYEYFNSFDSIVICFDNDEAKIAPDGTKFYPGQEAAMKVAQLFPRKAKIVKLTEYKDASDYLKNGKGDDFKRAWWGAERYRPEGIVTFDKEWYDYVMEDQVHESVPYPWDGLNNLTYGLRTSEMITFTGGSGMGKTQVLREIVHAVHQGTDRNIGMMMFEETKRDTMRGLMSVQASTPLHLPDHEVDEETKKQAFDTLADGRIHIFDHFGSNDIDTIINHITWMAKVLDCKYIILDHISIIVSDQRHGDERRALDEISTKLKCLTVDLDICLIMVSHLRRSSGTPHEEGGRTSLADLRGTAGIGQLSNMVIGLERNGQSDDPLERRKTTLRVLKNRFCGYVGPACQLLFDEETHRLTEMVMPDELDAVDLDEFTVIEEESNDE
jgi:twinkle protein